MMNYAWDISQSETEKYFEWTIIAFIEVTQGHLFLVGKKEDKKKKCLFLAYKQVIKRIIIYRI